MSAFEATPLTVPPLPAPRDKHLRRMADTIRALAMDAVEAANSGHPSGMPSMGMAKISRPPAMGPVPRNSIPPIRHWPGSRPLHPLQGGHGSMLLSRAATHRLRPVTPMFMPDERDRALSPTRQPLRRPSRARPSPPASKVTTGPLGQLASPIPVGTGAHRAACSLTRCGPELVDHVHPVFCGDGCLDGKAHQPGSDLDFAGYLEARQA